MTGPIVPNIWFNGNADEAVDYYMTVFENSKIINKEYYPTDEKALLATVKEMPLAFIKVYGKVILKGISAPAS